MLRGEFDYDPDILQARIKSLKEGNHNAVTARVTLWKIREAVIKGYVTWEQLGTSEEKLMQILQKKMQAEGMELREFKDTEEKEPAKEKVLIEFQVSKFLKVWKEYSAGNQKVLRDLLFEFNEIKQMLMAGEITPADLMPDFSPGEFFPLNELLEKYSP